MIRIAIVEDDDAYRRQLVDFLKRYESESGESFRLSLFSDGMEIVQDYRSEYDIILMDIEMRYMDGMTAAERIRKLDMEVVIIFITNMSQYVMKGYTVDAMDFVLKPITYYAFSQRIDRALQRMRRRSKHYIALSCQGGMMKLDVSEITYVEVLDHDLVYHTRRGGLYDERRSFRGGAAAGGEEFLPVQQRVSGESGICGVRAEFRGPGGRDPHSGEPPKEKGSAGRFE